jgi:hypothetical protein
MHTKDMLADELMRLGLMEMSLQARAGYYHDYLSPLALPELQLMQDLADAADNRPDRHLEILALRKRCANGDFEATSEESDDWAASPDGQEAFRQLIPKDKT